ncbi:MAG: hypothetical protein MZV63_58170 [Marinilabiliales bacterium]|nr:hypothetical protein [Marinilabiliales bacterium]
MECSIIILTITGGIEAVIWLDVIQGLLLMAGGLICLGICCSPRKEDLIAVWTVARENGHTGFGPFRLGLRQPDFLGNGHQRNISMLSRNMAPTRPLFSAI